MRPYLAEAAELARELGDSWRLSQILAWQATAALIGGDVVTTLKAAQEGLRLADDLGDRFVSRQCRIWIANARMYLGDLSGAAADSTGDRRGVSSSRCAHASHRSAGGSLALALQGDIDGARAAADEALDCSTQLGQYYDQACYGQLAITCLAAGDAAAAWEASKAAERDSAWQPMTTGLFVVYAALSALRCGDSTRRPTVGRRGRVDDEAASICRWRWRTVRASRSSSENSNTLNADAHEALALAAESGLRFWSRTFSSVSRGSRQTQRTSGRGSATWERPTRRELRMGAVRFKVLDADHDGMRCGTA